MIMLVYIFFYILVKCYLYNIFSGWWGFYWKSKNLILIIMIVLYYINYDGIINEWFF